MSAQLEWARVLALFEGCLEQPEDGRAAYLAQSSEMPAVVAEVARLLQHDRESGAFLEDAPEEVKDLHAPPEARFAPGQFLADRYEVLRLVGRGGMGEIYAVMDHLTETTMALKVIGTQVRREGLARELRLGREVTHRHVCRLYDLGRHQDSLFLTMELLEGETLAARIRRAGPLTLSEATPLAGQLLAGLAAIHQAGIIHRDLSPSNVMLLPGRAVIMDFGLALTEGEAPGAPIGTLDYMAPEQLQGKSVTTRTDLYSIGAVLEEMLSGEYSAPGAWLRQHLPSHWVAAIRAAVSPDPESRPATAGQLLDLLANPQPISSLPRHRSLQHRRPAAQIRQASRGRRR